MSEPLTFRSKVDTWVLVVLLLVVSIAVLGAEALVGLGTLTGWLGAALVGIVGIVLPLAILAYTRYALDEHYLTVHCGPARWAVPLKEISEVTPTLNAGVAPALSSSRVRVHYGDGRSILVSPDNKEIFMRSLETRRAELVGGTTAAS